MDAFQRVISLVDKISPRQREELRRCLEKGMTQKDQIPDIDGDAHRLSKLRRRLVQHRRDRDYTPPQDLLPLVNPLCFKVLPERTSTPKLNVVLPSLCMRHLSGGPNTALNLAYRLADSGVATRIIAACHPIDEDLDPLWRHLQYLSGIPRKLPIVQIIDASDRTGKAPLLMGKNDLFLATAWWTAQLVKYAIKETIPGAFVYLIQDYEPLLHPASTPYAMCLETYGLDYFPVFNSRLLQQYFISGKVGRFEGPKFAEKAVSFEPAVDRKLFYPEPFQSGRERRLLFYARPTSGLRNLFEMGVQALRLAVSRDVFSNEKWEIVGMGDQFTPVNLGKGVMLHPSPWCDLQTYAARMRQSDVMLALMLSPHPSYPPLEMAACGGVSVTTCFGNKTSEAVNRLSPRIIAVEPSIENLACAIEEAVKMTREDEDRNGQLSMPETWDISFSHVIPKINAFFRAMRGMPAVKRPWSRPENDALYPWGFSKWPVNTMGFMRQERFKLRRHLYPDLPAAGMFSLLTSVYDTDPDFLEYLARSVFEQDSNVDYEWVVLDNGSHNKETRDCLQRICTHPKVHFFRVEENLGIVGGMRYCMKKAKNRYIIPLDSDDYLYPDCLRVAVWHIIRNDFPKFLYSDEDHYNGDEFVHPFPKPDWDPVFFIYSCYIAHMCIMERDTALKLNLYDDSGLDGCHDWDSFTRAHLAGIKPVHIPEILYSWRIHEHSCAGDATAKPYVFASHRKLLQKFLKGQRRPELYSIETSPFHQVKMLDHWLRRTDQDMPRVKTVLLTEEVNPDLVHYQLTENTVHEVESLAPSLGLAGLIPIVEECARSGYLVHLIAADVTIDYPDWLYEVVSLFEFFPDTVMVGGRIHSDGKIKDAGQYFGFGRGCDAPDEGDAAKELGFLYRVLRQHSVSAVPWRHSVIKPEFLLKALHAILPHGAGYSMLGAWLGAEAMTEGKRVVYTPYLSAYVSADWCDESPGKELARWSVTYDQLIPDTRYYPNCLGLTLGSSKCAVTDTQRAAELKKRLKVGYPEWIEIRQRERQTRYPKPVNGHSFSILTTLYQGTSMLWFRETAASILAQDYGRFEWVVVSDAGVTDDMLDELQNILQDSRVQLHRLSEELGIIPKMKRGLEWCTGDYILPMDADDLLTPDALRILANHLLAGAKNGKPPVFLYSDEDIYEKDRPLIPLLRPGFDPILFLDASLVFHCCCFRRDLATALDLYSDGGTRWCHDWDTATRFIEAGHELMHVPEVIYHWRQHPQSLSNNTEGVNSGTVSSVRHMLQRRIDSFGKNRSRYEIGPLGIGLGDLNIGIRRRPVAPPDIRLVLLSATEECARYGFCAETFSAFPFVSTVVQHLSGKDKLESQASRTGLLSHLADGTFEYAVFARADLALDTPEGIWEALRLFELYPDIGFVGGRIVDADGRVCTSSGFLDLRGELCYPYNGKDENYDGPLALARRSQEAATVASELFVARKEALCRVLDWNGIPWPHPGALGGVFSAAAWDSGMKVAHAPLLQARSLLPRTIYPAGDTGGASVDIARTIRSVLGEKRQGAAAYGYYAGRFGDWV